jgi:hypothetical protein
MRALKIVVGLGLLISMAGCAVYAPPPPYGHRAHYWGHPAYYRY